MYFATLYIVIKRGKHKHFFLSYLILSYIILSYLILSYLILSYLILLTGDDGLLVESVGPGHGGLRLRRELHHLLLDGVHGAAAALGFLALADLKT